MASRLTTHLRQQISQAVLKHRFTDEVEALITDLAALADDIYNDVYRKAEREKIAAAPNGWLPETSHVSAKFDEASYSYAQIEFSGTVYGSLLKLRNKQSAPRSEYGRRVPYKHQTGCMKVYEPGHKLSVRYTEVKSRQDDLESRVRTAERQLEAALASASTVTTLLKAWPELEPFVKTLVPVPVKLPAIPVQSLNETFRLPVAEAA